MSEIETRFFNAPADATPAEVYAVPANLRAKLTHFTMAQPAGSPACVVRLTIGADADPTRVIQYPLEAGAQFKVINPGIVYEATETMELSCSGSDGVVVCTGNGKLFAA